MGSEASGFEQAACDVVREIPEAERGAAEVFESAVDRLCWPVRCAGAIEEREDVGGTLAHGAAEPADLYERGGDAGGDRIDRGVHHLFGLLLVGFPVGGDDALVDTPGRFDFDVLFDREHSLQAGGLFLSEQVRAGVQGAARFVERVTGAAAMPDRVLLHSASALVQRVAGEADNVEGVHDRDGVGEFFGGGRLEACEPVHRDDFDPLAPLGWARREPLLEHRLRTTLDHVQQPRGAGLVAGRGEVDDHGDVLVTEAGVPPDVLVDADRGDPVEPTRIVDESTLALREHRSVRGAPGNPETRGDTGHGEVVDGDAPQRPLHAKAGDLRSRRGGASHVLPPRPSAVRAPVAADPDQKRCRPMPERLMRESTRHRVPRHALRPALPTPGVHLDRPTLDHRPVPLDQLADRFEAEFIQAAERGQVRGRESRVEHVEVFRDGEREELPSSGRPRPLPGHRRAHPTTPSFAKSPERSGGARPTGTHSVAPA